MATKFYAINRQTKERWKRNKRYKKGKQFLMMFDSGYLAVVSNNDWEGMSVIPLDPKIWKTVIKSNFK